MEEMSWRKFNENRSPQENKNQFVLQYIPMVESIARQIVSKVSLTFEELRSAGIEALYLLFDSDQVKSGIPFEDFVREKIRSTMMDEERITFGIGNIVPLDHHAVEPGEKILARAEMEADIHRAIKKLSEHERQVLVLSVVEGLKYNQIASILGFTPSYVGKIYQTTIKKMRYWITGPGDYRRSPRRRS